MAASTSLDRNHLLGALPAAELDIVQRHLTEVSPVLGTVLQNADAPIDYVYFPLDGLISLVVMMRDGAAVETGVVGREGAEGTIVAIGAERAFTTATVQVPGLFLRMSATDFRGFQGDCPMLCRLFERYHASLFFQAKQLIACNALHRAEARLARWLLQVRDRIGRNRLELTHEFMAQMLAVRRTTVTEVLGVLQDAGLVRQYRGALELLDVGRLKDLTCECYDVMAEQQRHVMLSEPAPA